MMHLDIAVIPRTQSEESPYARCWKRFLVALGMTAVSYTHLTLPTIYSV